MAARSLITRALFMLVPACVLAEPPLTQQEAARFAVKYCFACHNDKSSTGGFNLQKVQDVPANVAAWHKALGRIREHEMPPQNAPAPKLEDRERWVQYLDATLKQAVCAAGVSAGRTPMRRLNRTEYTNTIRDLLNIHINAGQALPADGAGGEGFDNAAETLFLSPIHAEKYLEAAKLALEYGMRDPRSRAVFLPGEPNAALGPDLAARVTISRFLPRAFRRPPRDGELERYLGLYKNAVARGDSFRQAISFALQGILISPHFLFRLEEPNLTGQPRPADQYAMASRLSYFLWASMPDQTLFELAAGGKLQDPAVLREQVARMLKDQKAREMSVAFVEQWLGTRELGRDIKPDAKLFPAYYDEEVTSAIKYEPILFFQELLAENLSLMNLLESNFTIASNKLARFYGFDSKGLRQQPVKIDLPEGIHRGGLLGMAAVLAVTSYPQRTSPVLRGKWVLDAMLGTPPPPPPPNVPELKDEHGAAAPRTMRERLTQHRQNPACASCHNRMDPIGFALENFDVIGLWRAEEAGKPVDATGELPDGTRFQGPDGLRQALLDRKDLFLRNLTSKFLGYAIGRGLTLEDSCTVDQILARVKLEEYKAQTLVSEIVLSLPFRYQQAAAPAPAAVKIAKETR